MPWLLLTIYHLILFRAFYFKNPYAYASSELLEQGFSSWLALGQAYRHGTLVTNDTYYPDYHALPFLSSFYPPHAVTAWIATFLSLNHAWILYSFTMVAHFWLASVSVYILVTAMGLAPLTAGFASVTLSTLGYAMKQNSSIVYTCSWVPIWVLSCLMKNEWLSGTSFGLMLLAGYWPIALPTIGLGCLVWLLH